MKKALISILILIVAQLAVMFGTLWVVVSLRGDCSFVSGQTAEWQCSGDADPALLPLIAFVVLPPILGKLFLDKIKQKISWRRIIITHVITGLLLLGTLAALDGVNCSCGGA